MPQTIEKSASNYLSLATIAYVRQAPSPKLIWVVYLGNFPIRISGKFNRRLTNIYTLSLSSPCIIYKNYIS